MLKEGEVSEAMVRAVSEVLRVREKVCPIHGCLDMKNMWDV